MGRSVERPLTAAALAIELGAPVLGDGGIRIVGVASLGAAATGDLSFFADSKYRAAAKNTSASVLILREADVDVTACVRIVTADPHMAFARALDLLFPVVTPRAVVSKLASVSVSARVTGAHISEFTYVGNNAIVGKGTAVYSQVFIGDDVVVGEGCVLYPGVRLLSGVCLGDRCIVHAGAVIGADGFGFQPTRNGWRKVAQVGSVTIGNDVEVGANTTIDRGAIEDTIIGNGVKIDNLVQIAHNVRIGDHTAIAGCAGIAGSALIGARCMIGGAAMIVGHVTICDDVVVSGGTLVSSSIAQPGRYTGVFPATEHKDWTKIAGRLRRSAKPQPR